MDCDRNWLRLVTSHFFSLLSLMESHQLYLSFVALSEGVGISVLIVCPGPVKTEINSTRLGTEGTSVGLDMSRAMAVDQCVEMMHRAATKHKREELFIPLQK